MFLLFARHPFIFTDAVNTAEFEGQLLGGQSSNYVLFKLDVREKSYIIPISTSFVIYPIPRTPRLPFTLSRLINVIILFKNELSRHSLLKKPSKKSLKSIKRCR